MKLIDLHDIGCDYVHYYHHSQSGLTVAIPFPIQMGDAWRKAIGERLFNPTTMYAFGDIDFDVYEDKRIKYFDSTAYPKGVGTDQVSAYNDLINSFKKVSGMGEAVVMRWMQRTLIQWAFEIDLNERLIQATEEYCLILNAELGKCVVTNGEFDSHLRHWVITFADKEPEQPSISQITESLKETMGKYEVNHPHLPSNVVKMLDRITEEGSSNVSARNEFLSAIGARRITTFYDSENQLCHAIPIPGLRAVDWEPYVANIAQTEVGDRIHFWIVSDTTGARKEFLQHKLYPCGTGLTPDAAIRDLWRVIDKIPPEFWDPIKWIVAISQTFWIKATIAANTTPLTPYKRKFTDDLRERYRFDELERLWDLWMARPINASHRNETPAEEKTEMAIERGTNEQDRIKNIHRALDERFKNHILSVKHGDAWISILVPSMTPEVLDAGWGLELSDVQLSNLLMSEYHDEHTWYTWSMIATYHAFNLSKWYPFATAATLEQSIGKIENKLAQVPYVLVDSYASFVDQKFSGWLQTMRAFKVTGSLNSRPGESAEEVKLLKNTKEPNALDMWYDAYVKTNPV